MRQMELVQVDQASSRGILVHEQIFLWGVRLGLPRLCTFLLSFLLLTGDDFGNFVVERWDISRLWYCLWNCGARDECRFFVGGLNNCWFWVSGWDNRRSCEDG